MAALPPGALEGKGGGRFAGRCGQRIRGVGLGLIEMVGEMCAGGGGGDGGKMEVVFCPERGMWGGGRPGRSGAGGSSERLFMWPRLRLEPALPV